MSFFAGHAGLALALAAASFSPLGTSDTGHSHGLLLSGSITEGDSPSSFSQSIDLQNGYNKRTQKMGDGEAQFGFDGRPWDESNGIVTVTNLPSAVAERRAEAWIDSRAWRERMARDRQKTRRVAPTGTSPISLTFDPDTGLLREATIAADWGPVVYRYSDWRRVGEFTYPFHREEVTSTGERTIIQIESARSVRSLPEGSLSRPPRGSRAERPPEGATEVPFTTVGARKSHILVDALINDKPAKLIFDTGAANFIASDSATRFAVNVTGGLNLSGVGEASTTAGYATVDRIALGGAVLRNETLVVGPSPFPRQNGKPAGADGFTGFEFLAEYITTIDYQAQKIRFATELPIAPRALRVPFFNNGSHIYVQAKINGFSGLFGLDTGDGGSITIFPAFAKRAGVHGDVGRRGIEGSGIGGAAKAQFGLVNHFSFGGLGFEQLPVAYSQNKVGPFASQSIAGNMGAGILQCFRITIDFAHNFLILEPTPESQRCAPGGTVIAPKRSP